MRLIRRIPKRGFNRGCKETFVVVPVSALDCFEEGAEVTPDLLRAKGLVTGKRRVKILGGGELKKKLIVKANAFSETAQRQILKAGGVCSILPR